ncbi:hypothetical protein JCM3766R1_004645 [Sporobolomyces carnicolor]
MSATSPADSAATPRTAPYLHKPLPPTPPTTSQTDSDNSEPVVTILRSRKTVRHRSRAPSPPQGDSGAKEEEETPAAARWGSSTSETSTDSDSTVDYRPRKKQRNAASKQSRPQKQGRKQKQPRKAKGNQAKEPPVVQRSRSPDENGMRPIKEYIKPDLDIVICGMNPGQKAGTVKSMNKAFQRESTPMPPSQALQVQTSCSILVFNGKDVAQRFSEFMRNKKQVNVEVGLQPISLSLPPRRVGRPRDQIFVWCLESTSGSNSKPREYKIGLFRDLKQALESLKSTDLIRLKENHIEYRAEDYGFVHDDSDLETETSQSSHNSSEEDDQLGTDSDDVASSDARAELAEMPIEQEDVRQDCEPSADSESDYQSCDEIEEIRGSFDDESSPIHQTTVTEERTGMMQMSQGTQVVDHDGEKSGATRAETSCCCM